MHLTRRSFAVGAAAGAVAPGRPAAGRKTVAAIVTEYRRLSHADVICGRILQGYAPNGVPRSPRTRIVSMYTDQVPGNDMSRDLAQKHGFRIFPTVEEALTLGGGRLAVDAVLLVGEHGDYPTNEKGQKLYPRYELYRKITAVFRASRRSVPLFCDKHLSYAWPRARAMYEEARALGFPFMAGSSIPLTVRRPPVDVPLGAPLEAAVGVSYGGLEVYGFHGLEAVQSLVERRRGGEVGVRAVECLSGEAVWRWRQSEAGRWSAPLLEAALAAAAGRTSGKPEDVKAPHVFVVEHRDGFRTALYHLDGHARDFLFAGRLAGRPTPVATRFGDPAGRELKHFDGLVDCIEQMFVSGRSVYPVERTLLTTGALAFLMESRFQKQRLETPELAIAYKPPAVEYTQRA
jgi:hypothetical protein